MSIRPGKWGCVRVQGRGPRPEWERPPALLVQTVRPRPGYIDPGQSPDTEGSGDILNRELRAASLAPSPWQWRSACLSTPSSSGYEDTMFLLRELGWASF